SRSPERPMKLPDGVRVVGWDARTAEGWGELADGADAIVNLAGAPLNRPWTSRYKRLIRDSRLDAGRAVVEAVEAARSRPSVVLQASGVSLYGPRGDELVAEGEGAADTFLGRTAVEWEAATAPVESLGVRRAIVRSGVVLSTQGGAFPLLVLPFRLFVGGALGTGKQWLPWIHIKDQVRAIRFLIGNEAAVGPFNLTAPDTVTNAEFSRVLGRVMQRPAFFRVPAFALRLALGEMSTVVLDGQQAASDKLRDLGFTFRFPTLEMALRDLLD
ncbi:MAG: TIGR01777 family oxidoreductase, partial [Anaerolineae bacterium]